MATNWLLRMTADPSSWLLNHSDPMIRYRALTWLEELSENDPRVEQARAEAAAHPRLTALLAGQNEAGWWEAPELFADDYYYGAAWRLFLAAQLGAERTPAVAKGIEYLFSCSQSRQGGGFSHEGEASRGGTLRGQWACLTGAILETLIHFGYAADPRTERALGFIASRQQHDGLYSCINFKDNASTLPLNCFIGSIRPLFAVLALPQEAMTPPLRQLLSRTAETLLTYKLYMYKRAPNGLPAAKSDWLQFGFPRFWNTDVLEVAWVLARLGHGSRAEMEPVVQLILDRQLKNGRWKLEYDYNDRMPIPLGKLHVSNPWITLRAVHTLRLCSNRARLQTV